MQHATDRNSECTTTVVLPELQQLQQRLLAAAPKRPQNVLGHIGAYFGEVADMAAETISDLMSNIPGLESVASQRQEGKRGQVAGNRVRARLQRANFRGSQRAQIRLQIQGFEVQLSQNEYLMSCLNEDEAERERKDPRSWSERTKAKREGTDHWYRTYELRRNRLQVDANHLQTLSAAAHAMHAQIGKDDEEDAI